MSSQPLHNHMDLFTELYKILGSKIQFKTSDGEYEGIIKLALPQSQRVTFEHVYYVPTGEYMGNLNFFLREFLSYKVIESVDSLQKYEKWDYVSQILDRNYHGIKYHLKDLFNGELDNQSETDESIHYPDEIVDDFVLHLPGNHHSKLPQDSLILESFDTEFLQAIKYISQQSVIGVSFEGPKISRLGKLSWICISTPYCVFLFDIELLGKTAFDKGLRSIFQDKKIEKVIHDCRQASDCLSHLFKTELVNVFDTQVADYIVNMQRYSDRPVFKYVSSLDCCLVNHLDVPQEFLYNRRKHLSYDQEELFFRMRPVSNDYRDVIIKNALYLILLKDSLVEAMMSPFRKAVDVYLKVLSNASEAELLLQPSVPDKIPPALMMQGIQTVCFQEIPEKVAIPLVCKFKESQKEGNGVFPNVLDAVPENISSKNSGINIDLDETENTISINTSHSPQKLNSLKSTKNNVGVLTEQTSQSSLDKVSNSVQNASKNSKLNSLEKLKLLKPTKSNNSVVSEQMYVKNSKTHLDNVYHRLVNGLHGSSMSDNIIDIKPAEEYLSNFVVKQTILQNNSEKLVVKPKHNVESNSDNSLELSDTSSDIVTTDTTNTSSDSSDTWSVLRSAFGVSSNDVSNIRNTNRKIMFLPAGMYP